MKGANISLSKAMAISLSISILISNSKLISVTHLRIPSSPPLEGLGEDSTTLR
jgi:hypothetical protein